MSHLFFADDTLIFCIANKEEGEKVMQLLKRYGDASGQVINAEKSSVFFSKNTRKEGKAEILDILGGMKEAKQSKYLGLPLVIGRPKRQIFNYIRERVINRMCGWKARLLSNAGKEVLKICDPSFDCLCYELLQTSKGIMHGYL